MPNISNQEIIDKLVEGEDYYISLMTTNLAYMNIGLPVENLKKINSIYYTITTLRYRVDRIVFDNTSIKLYYRLVRLLPIN